MGYKMEIYTNELHKALLHKQGVAFWKSWKSKFERNNRAVTKVNGLSDACNVAERFTALLNAQAGMAKT